MPTITITPCEIITAKRNSNLMELAASKGLPLTPILRQIDWKKVKQVTYHQDPCTQNYMITWSEK
jgi:hypothetical protein